MQVPFPDTNFEWSPISDSAMRLVPYLIFRQYTLVSVQLCQSRQTPAVKRGNLLPVDEKRVFQNAKSVAHSRGATSTATHKIVPSLTADD